MNDKYPRTPHLPYSPGCSRDDRVIHSTKPFIRQDIVITEKMDGSNCCLEREGIYARSHDCHTQLHPSFNYAKAFHARIWDYIPPRLSLFGEYCYAIHSIEYKELPNYFFLFGIRVGGISWSPWDDVEEYAEFLGVPTTPVLWRGIVYSEAELKGMVELLASQSSIYGGDREGVVVRRADGFLSGAFGENVAKYVRKDHVQTDEHWASGPIRKQRLKKE